MFNVPNSDSHIVDLSGLTIGLSKHMVNQIPIIIRLGEEGPCAHELGLYKLLDRLTNEFNFSKSDITIVTSNLLEQHDFYNIKIIPQMVYLDSAKNFSTAKIFKRKRFDNQFKHFGNFIGHGNAYRLYVASQLYSKYKDLTLQSYHYARHSDYHKMFVGLEDLLYGAYTREEVDCAYNLLNSSPLALDEIDNYPILNPETFNITKVYDSFFVEIVNLTYFSGNTFYTDEKIWRPIIMRTPFMIQGPQNFILNLRKLGFKTFDQFWDEGYSEDPVDCQVRPIMSNVKQLSTKTITELNDMYNDMTQILEHNYQRLYELNLDDFNNVRK